MDIAIIGAGHAGVEAARVAAEAGARVTLYGDEGVLPYYRPRLVALAFGELRLENMFQHPAAWFAERQIALRCDAPVTALDPAGLRVTAGGIPEAFDALILANGAVPLLPAFAAVAPEAVLPLWTARQADGIHARVRAGARVVVLGGGILGLEAALRAVAAGLRVHLVERMPHLMPAQFGPRASRVLRRRLEAKGIGLSLGRTLTGVARGADGLRLVLDDGAGLEADLILVSMGARPGLALAQAAGLTTDRGVAVDRQLRTSAPRVFAAGDVAQCAGLTRCSVREALAQGRVAGANAVALLAGRPLQAYRPETLPLAFKNGDFELYALGQPGGDGHEEDVLDGSTELVLRSLVKRNNVTVGVQMIGTREGFDALAAQVPAPAW